MIHFVVAMGPPSDRPAGGDLSRAIRDTTNIGGVEVSACAPSGTWSMAAMTASDPLLATRWHTDGEGLVVCNGPVTGSPPVSLDAVLARFRAGGLDSAAGPLTGTYNLVCVSPEHGLTMSGDFGAFFPLYYGARPGLAVVSNKASTVAAALGTSGWNVHSLAWIIGAGQICGEDMPPAGVSSLRAGYVGRAPWGADRITTAPPPRPLMPPPGTGAGRPELTSAEWDDITEDLVEEVRRLAAIDTPRFLQLSGGKDSRLLLSLLVAAGVTDIEAYTSGGPDSTEVRCAADVAAAVGLTHHLDIPPEARRSVSREVVGGQPYPGPAGRTWRKIAQGMGRFDGILPTWVLKTPQGATSLVLKGWAGEVYRFKSRAAGFDELAPLLPPLSGSTPDVAGLTSCLGFHLDPLRVLTKQERARQRAWMGQWVEETVSTVRPDLLPDLFYIDHHLGQISGPAMQGVPLRVVANPLASFGAATKYCELSLAARSVDRLHFEVMRRAAPQLVGLPFVDQVWPLEIHATSPIELATSPFGHPPRKRPKVIPPPTPPVGSRLPFGDSSFARRARVARQRAREHVQWRARVDWMAGSRRSQPRPEPHDPFRVLVDEYPALVAMLFRAAGDAGLSEICDVDRLSRLVSRRGLLNHPEELQITSTIGIAMLLLGKTERVVDTPEPGKQFVPAEAG